MKTKEELAFLYDRLIKSIVSKYSYYHDKDDLYQVGFIGLMKALKNYKENKNTKFSSYAYFYIDGEIKEYIRTNNSIKYSKEFISLKQSYEKAKNLLSQKLERMPTIVELSQFLEIPIDKIKEIEASKQSIESLDNNEEETSLYSYIGFSEEAYKEENIDLKTAIENLKEPDKTIIISRYMEGLTQSETSNLLGISQVQVSRKEKDALVRLRTTLK